MWSRYLWSRYALNSSFRPSGSLLRLLFAHRVSSAMSTTTIETGNAEIYSPLKVLQHPDFRILSPGEKPLPTANIAAFYNPAHEIHLVEKPRPTPGPGQVLLHVRATGICGWVLSYAPVFSLWPMQRVGAMSISGSMAESETRWWLQTRYVQCYSVLKPRQCPFQCGSGHESAGEVVEVGEGVTQWKVGENCTN